MKLNIFLKNFRYLFKFSFKDYYIKQKQLENELFQVKHTLYKILRKSQTFTPQILSIDETVELIIKKKASFSRFGDGELMLINNKSIPFQSSNPKLSQRLEEILNTDEEQFYCGIASIYYADNNDNYTELVKEFVPEFYIKNYELLYKNLNKNKKYIPTELTQLYQVYENYDFKNYFEKIRTIWKDKKITIVCGKNILDKLKFNIFDCAEEVTFQFEANKNAFEHYEAIYQRALQNDRAKLVIIILGSTATLLAYDLYKKGYQALDLGHIAKDYDAFMRKEMRTKQQAAQFYAPD